MEKEDDMLQGRVLWDSEGRVMLAEVDGTPEANRGGRSDLRQEDRRLTDTQELWAELPA